MSDWHNRAAEEIEQEYLAGDDDLTQMLEAAGFTILGGSSGKVAVEDTTNRVPVEIISVEERKTQWFEDNVLPSAESVIERIRASRESRPERASTEGACGRGAERKCCGGGCGRG